jgi:hypothetical protein
MYASVNYNEFSGQVRTYRTLYTPPPPLLLTFPVSFFLMKKLVVRRLTVIFGGPILGVARRERLQPESNLCNKLVTIPG